MATLPERGDTNWDTALNGVITEEHNSDGTHIKSKLLSAMEWSPTTYSGEESVTLPNGLVIKFGAQATVSTSGVTTEFETPFDNECITVIICDAASGGKADGSNGSNVMSFNKNGFTADTGDSSITKVNWIAIGY